MVHARTPFVVILEAIETSVLLTVQDGSTAAPRLAATPYLDSGGRGLFLVQMLCRDWGVRMDAEGGKAVWASFETGDGATD